MQDEYKSDVTYSIRIIILALITASYAVLSSQALASTVELYYSLGQDYMKQGKYDMAALSLGKAVELAPDWPEAHNALGEAYVKLLRFDEALAQFSKAVELNPDYIEAKLNYRRTTMSVERYKPTEGSRFSQWQKLSILGLLTVVVAVVAAFVVYSYSS